ncbi:hypothetical protein D1007_15005 [Hordeum vulgare]|nr:hypothetical protein D1007_15005 [Hordeum vulgare]
MAAPNGGPYWTIFVDGTGKNAPWMWLKALTVFDNKFSWGSVSLAYLYRQLDEACHRSTKDGVIGGCMLLLSVWSWEHLPVGCPKGATWKPWDDDGNPVWLPTWAYKWDVESTRVEICPLAYEEDILEEPIEYDALAHGEYKRLIRQGYRTSFAPVLNFVRKEIKKQADATEAILDTTHGGKKGESALRLFMKKQGQKLRRLYNILGCCDPEYSEPSRSGSSHRNTLDDSTSSGARMDDGGITSRAHLEDDVDTPEVQDGMTLKAFQRSAYMLKPRKGFKRYTPEDYVNKGKNLVLGGSRMTEDVTRMRGMDDEDDDEDELDEMQPVVRRKKLASKRGRG